MTRPLSRRHRRRPGAPPHDPSDGTSVLTARARWTDTLARAFGALVIVTTLAAAFGGWIATLR